MRNKYFPFFVLALSMAVELLMQALDSPMAVRGCILFYITPLVLLLWLVYVPIKMPEVVFQIYYWIIMAVCFMFLISIIAYGVYVKTDILNKDNPTMQNYTAVCFNVMLIGIIIIFRIYFKKFKNKA